MMGNKSVDVTPLSIVRNVITWSKLPENEYIQAGFKTQNQDRFHKRSAFKMKYIVEKALI